LNPGRINIAIMIPCLLTGGTELQTLSLVRILKTLDHDLSLICYYESDISMVLKFQKLGVRMRLLNLGRNWSIFKTILCLRKELLAVRPDIVHVQYMAPGALPIIAARLAGVKTIFATVHQPYTKSHGRLAKIVLRSASLLVSRFICVSQNAEISWFGSSHLYNENLSLHSQHHHFTIHNAVDLKRIDVILSGTDNSFFFDHFMIPSGTLIIGAILRLRYEKGIDILLDAFEKLRNDCPETHLLIVGSGPMMDELVQKTKEYGIGDSVTFYGEVDWENAIRLLGIMDIVVVPSRFEGFGLTAAEAMAAGRPVIASDSFGLKEVVQDEKTGLLFTAEDSFMLKDKLLRLCNDPSARNIYGKSGRKACESLYGFNLFKEKILSLYSLNQAIK
jgi:L-malate glycosyltransferase